MAGLVIFNSVTGTVPSTADIGASVLMLVVGAVLAVLASRWERN